MAINNRTGTAQENNSQHYFGENINAIDFIDNLSVNIDIDSQGKGNKKA